MPTLESLARLFEHHYWLHLLCGSTELNDDYSQPASEGNRHVSEYGRRSRNVLFGPPKSVSLRLLGKNLVREMNCNLIDV
jgi:hypothetical protein